MLSHVPPIYVDAQCSASKLSETFSFNLLFTLVKHLLLLLFTKLHSSTVTPIHIRLKYLVQVQGAMKTEVDVTN